MAASFLTTPSAMAALTCTVAISLIPNLILFLFPNVKATSVWLQAGQSLAAGGLLGDVFLHTLPHASNQEEAGLWILLGFSVFFIVDLAIRSLEGGGHGHSHSHAPVAENGSEKDKDHRFHSWFWSSTILLNLSADALHNFTDGIAIGASFSLDQHHSLENGTVWQLLSSRGGLAFLSVLFHEVPHELGDYCILVGNGMTKTQAILAQFTTAIAAMIGTIVGLWGAELHSDTMMYMTAGGFIYLATVNILPSVLEDSTIGKSFLFQLAQLCAFGLGIAFMLGVSILEHEGHGHDHGGHIHDHGGHSHDHHRHEEHHHEVRYHHHEHEL